MDEYISRQEAIKALYEVYEHEYPTASGDFDEYASHDVPNVLRNIPSADVQPVKHGRWIDTGSGQECSICKEIQYGYDTGRHYCPNCGSKNRMDGDSDD